MTWLSYLPKEVSEGNIVIPVWLYLSQWHRYRNEFGQIGCFSKWFVKGPFPWCRCVSLASTCESLSQWIFCRTFPSMQSSHCIPSQPQRPQRKSNDKGSSNRWEEVTGPPANSAELTLSGADRLSLSCCCIVIYLHVPSHIHTVHTHMQLISQQKHKK